MKNLYKALASAAIALLAASCVNEMGNDTTDGLFRKYNLSFEGSTKTELSGTGNTRQVKWTDGDDIKYYTVDKQPSASTASVTVDGSSAFVEIPRGRNDDFINAVYGAGSLTVSSSTSDCMYVVSPAKSDQSYTTFAQAHLCAAFSSDLEDPNLRFHNAVAILKFTSAASISKVVFSGNKGEVITGGSNGSLKITYSGGAISAAPASTGGTSVTVITAGQESDFYIAILPVNFTEGIIVRGYDASGYLLCERKTSGELNTVNAAGLPIIANLGSLQDWLDNPKPTAVDLGLSVKWASFNLGASTPEGSGDYFSWGETAPKSSYIWSTYAYGQSKNGPFSEYVVNAAHGTPDYKTILDLEDDAAHAIWGDAWRIPSKEEVQELRNNCNWQWTTMNGVAGYKVTSMKSGYTGNFIFLPAAGMMSGSKVQNAGTEGDYWSSSLYTTESCSSWSPYFTSSQFSTADCYRYFGLPVRAVYGEIVPVTEITLSSTSMDLLIGQTGQLTATVLPENSTYKGLIWTSSDESVATVDVTGKVTAVSIGTISITAHSSDGKKSASCEVTVLQKAESITLDKTSLEIYVGDEPVALVATVQPDTYTSKDFTWSSSNKSVATVDEEGKVTAVANGTATITVSAKDGSGLTARCAVTVRTHVSSITLNRNEATINVGSTLSLSATISPSTASNKTINWSSDDTSIATVNTSGKITAVGPGRATITATTVDGELTASCNVTVLQKAKSITLDRSSLEMYIGDEPITLVATILPENTSDKSVTWTSSNSSVAKVDSDGKVTAVSYGSASITVKTNDGSGRSASCSVRVYNHVESVSLNKTEMTLLLGNTSTLTATVLPSTSNKSVIWTSSDEGVATVDQSGKVTAAGLGKSSVTVTTVDGAKTATCEVTVYQLAHSITLDHTELELYVGDAPVTLTATVLPSEYTMKTINWKSSDSSIATVDSEGKVTAISAGSTKISALATDGSNVSAACMVTVKINLSLPDAVEAVDLGLPSGLKWASMNVGATKPEEYGEYFAWGETQPKTDYSWSTYKWCNGSSNTQTKYNTSSSYGTVDNKTVLDPEDDAAHVNWGGSWRMPTLEEYDELINKCTWTWTTQNGVKGRLVTGPNGKSIFLPVAGFRNVANLYYAGSYGSYWSSSLRTDYPLIAWLVSFNSDDVRRGSGSGRDGGFSVRPVTE